MDCALHCKYFVASLAVIPIYCCGLRAFGSSTHSKA